jgi:hypothetical protein
MLYEGDKVSPVCTIVALFHMAFIPAMEVGCMDEIYLSPFQFPLWKDILSIGLHTPTQLLVILLICWDAGNCMTEEM